MHKLFTKQSLLLMTQIEGPFENILGKGENAGNQHFLLFPQCFLPFTKQISNFQSPLFCLHMLSIWTNKNVGVWKGLSSLFTEHSSCIF